MFPNLPLPRLGTPAADQIFGSAWDDLVFGFGGDDVIRLRGGDDRAYGGMGDDDLRGDGGNDALFGGSGRDHLTGGTGNDHLFGGSGSDLFFFDPSRAGEGRDVIGDFQLGRDKIVLNVADVLELTPGLAGAIIAGGGDVAAVLEALDHSPLGACARTPPATW